MNRYRRPLLGLLLLAMLGGAAGAGYYIGEQRGYRQGLRRGVDRGIEKAKELGPPPVNAGNVLWTELASAGLVPAEVEPGFDPDLVAAALNLAQSPCSDQVDRGVSLASCLSDPEELKACPSCRSQAEFLVAHADTGVGVDWLVDRAKRETRMAVDDGLGQVLTGSGKVQVTVFSDYQCPFCERAEPMLNDLPKFTDNATVRVVQFPLSFHKQAEPAARAALAAARQGRFPEMHRALFGDYKNLKKLMDADPPFKAPADRIGLDLDKFAKDLADPVIAQQVKNELTTAQGLGVRGTPTIFVDGIKYKGGRSAKELAEFVDASVERVDMFAEQAEAPIDEAERAQDPAEGSAP